MGELLKSIFENPGYLDSLLAIVMSIGTIGALIYYKIFKKVWVFFRKEKVAIALKKPCIAYFTDRKQISREIFEEIEQSTSALFQIYGPAGVGKTEFAKLLNMALNDPSKIKEERDFIAGFGYNGEKGSISYIIDCFNKNSRNEVFYHICRAFQIDENDPSSIQLLVNKLNNYKQVLLIFDHIGSPSLAHELYLFYEDIIGLVEHTRCFFLLLYSHGLRPSLQDSNDRYIKRMDSFDDKDTKSFLEKRNFTFGQADMEKVFDITKGNVLLLTKISDLYVKTQKLPANFLDIEDICEYFYGYMNDSDKQLFISFLTLCFSKNEVFLNDLNKITEISDFRKSMIKLKNLGLVQEIEEGNNHFCIQESLFLLFCNKEFPLIEHKQFEIIKLLDNSNLNLNEFKLIHYIFSQNENTLQSILNTLQEYNDKKDYRIILRISYLFENIKIFRQLVEKEHNTSFFSTLLFFILEGLIGCGQYKHAMNLVESESFMKYFTIRAENVDGNNFDLNFAYGNLNHLIHRYEDAINHFEVMSQSVFVAGSPEYLSKCLWGIAHCYRHMGIFPIALNYYEQAIFECEKCEDFTKGIRIKCLNERNSIFLYENKEMPGSFDDVDSLISPTNQVATLSTNKYKAIKLGSEKQFDEALNLLEKTMNVYLKTQDRHLYNLYFEKGELLRRKKDFSTAVLYFKKSLDAAVYNGDRNIELYSTLGLLSVELESNLHIFTNNRKEQLDLLQKCFELCMDQDKVIFKLGEIHTVNLKQFFDQPDESTSVFESILPLL